MKKIKKIVAILLASTFVVGCGSTPSTNNGTTPNISANTEETTKDNDGSTQLNLYTWEGMFPQEILDSFESETGIKINYVNFDYDETMLSKLQAANGGDYDLVIADDYIIETAISEGLVQELDSSKLTNYKNINSIYQNQFFDPAGKYTFPYGAGIQTIVYDPTLVDKEITSYSDLWDSSLADNVGVVANYRVINGMALKTLNNSYNTEDISEIEAAGEKLLELAPNIRIIKDDNLQDDLLMGEVGAAIMYTSQTTLAKLSNPELKVVFPEEGIGFGIMAGFIPSNAPHPDAAYKFIDYILDAQNAATCFEYLGYYCTNLAAEDYISEDFKEFLTLPANIEESQMEMIQNISPDAEATHEKIWTAFKTACGN